MIKKWTLGLSIALALIAGGLGFAAAEQATADQASSAVVSDSTELAASLEASLFTDGSELIRTGAGPLFCTPGIICRSNSDCGAAGFCNFNVFPPCCNCY